MKRRSAIRLGWFVWACFGSLVVLYAQGPNPRPKLVVGIVVDQMRNDFLQRYQGQLSGGFARMSREGFYCANAHYGYMPTTTGPGHASIYTGTTPAVHGIAANDWYDPRTKENMYCVQDKSVRTIGVANADGQMSPANLQTTTVTDELMLSLNFRSKVIGLSIKDRGAVLPAGHLGKAYWFSAGNMISSSYYCEDLPTWVKDFNAQNLPSAYIKKGWYPLLPMEQYTSSLADDNPYEGKFAEEEAPVLPKNLELLAKANGMYNVFRRTPHCNSYLLDFARAAIEEEDLGGDADTDFLCISFSTPDYLGHALGTRAVEIQDMYLRLDRDLGQFLEYLDARVGKDAYMVFLTADHGAADVPQFSMDRGLPAGYLDEAALRSKVLEVLTELHPKGASFLEKMENDKVYFDHMALQNAGADYDEVCRRVTHTLKMQPGVYNAYPTRGILEQGGAEWPILQLTKGLYPALAGDIAIVAKSGWIAYGPTGTTHGAAYTYDTHIPLLFFGKGIPRGTTYREVHIRDIAPTLSMLLNVSLPSGSTGSPILELWK